VLAQKVKHKTFEKKHLVDVSVLHVSPTTALHSIGCWPLFIWTLCSSVYYPSLQWSKLIVSKHTL